MIFPGKPQMHSGGEMPSLPSGSHPVKSTAQPRKSSQPDVCASQEKPLRTLAHQAEEEIEDGGLFIPMGRLFFLFIKLKCNMQETAHIQRYPSILNFFLLFGLHPQHMKFPG